MLEYDRGKRAEVSGLLGGLCGAATPELDDVVPIYTETYPHRSRHFNPRIRPLSILPGLKQVRIVHPGDSGEYDPADTATKEDIAARLAFQKKRESAKKGQLTSPWRHL